jgi:hypothetical protein
LPRERVRRFSPLTALIVGQRVIKVAHARPGAVDQMQRGNRRIVGDIAVHRGLVRAEFQHIA